MAAKNGSSNLRRGHWFVAICLPGLLALGCQREAPAPPADAKALQREAEKLKKEHDRETHNR